MAEKQRTLTKEVNISGRGLHTGLNVNLSIKPAPANHGIRFMRIDLEENPVVHAIVDNVVDTSRGTTLDEDGVRIGTIEHLMASLNGCCVDNALIEIDAPEAPILDGSAKTITEKILSAGITELEVDKNILNLKKELNLLM